MSVLLLSVTAGLIASGVGLQIWSTAPARKGRQYALQLPVVLLYSLGGALFLFTAFPDSLSDGRALGFSLGGAAGFAAFFMSLSFGWLSRTRRYDQLATELKKTSRENMLLRGKLLSAEVGKETPRPLTQTIRYEVLVRGSQRHRLGTITGDLANVFGADVWVNPENTRMEMSRITEQTISATIRYHGSQRDATGNLVDDTIARALAKQMAGHAQVTAGHVLVTGPGALMDSHQVKRLIHVAAVEGEPASGFRQVMDLQRCVRNILTKVDQLNREGEALRSVVLPLLGTGGGNSDVRETAETLTAATVGYFRERSASSIRTVYLLAYTDIQATICRNALDLHDGLTQRSEGR